MVSFRPLFLSGVLLLAASRANAQVTIDFDDLSLVNYGPIPGNYASGTVPHLSDIAYRTLNPGNGAVVQPYLEFWNNDYGDLSKVAFAAENGRVAEIAFTPEVGYAVHLISFDMAGYNRTDLVTPVLRLVDASDNVVFDFTAQAAPGPLTIQGDANGPQHSSFTPDITYGGTLRLQWGNNWNVGIDNIRIEAVAIPEASTVALLGVGAAGLIAAQGWRRKRARDTK